MQDLKYSFPNSILLICIFLNGGSCATPVFQRTSASTRPTLQLAPCRFPNYSQDILCGEYDVFEDRLTKSGRKISLNVVVLPALTSNPAPDPVFFLYGGPGEGAAVAATRGGDAYWHRLRHDRDLVFVDQRGTGNSHSLRCTFIGNRTLVQSYFDDIFPVDQIRACRAELETTADLRLYTTPIAVGDLDEVRDALRYDKVNLYGISYGTQAALEYLRQHAEHVRSAVLTGVVTLAAKQPLQFARGAQTAMNKLMEDCRADDVCRNAFPNFETEFAAVLAALDRAPVRFALNHPATKERQAVQMSRGVFVEALRFMLYGWSAPGLLPLLIHHAAQGNWIPFGRAALPLMARAEYAVSGMYLTITCSETVPLITDEDIARETGDTFMGDYRTRRHQQACQEWPKGNISADYYRPIKSDVPVLMVSAEFDPATPPQLAREAKRFLVNSRQVLVGSLGHGYTSVCIRKLTVEFIAKASVEELDLQCIESMPAPSFVTELPPRLRR
jgi:pimeloyl-ACP methyl ester carboxylesterase